MSFSGKLTSFLEVVESAYRDTGIDFIDYENAVAWTTELMGLMGTPYSYVHKVTDGIDGMPLYLSVNNYRCMLPDDLIALKSARRVEVSNGSVVRYIPMIETAETFRQVNTDLDNSNVWAPVVPIDVFDPATEDFDYTRELIEFTFPSSSTGSESKYRLDQGTIFTDFESGAIQLSYTGYPIDANGMPLIPDDPKFKEALKFHIIYKLDWRKWRMNPSPQNKSILNDSNQQRDFYVAAARNKSHIPSVDKLEAIKKMWLRTNPNINEHSNGFSTLNVQEQRYNNRRN